MTPSMPVSATSATMSSSWASLRSGAIFRNTGRCNVLGPVVLLQALQQGGQRSAVLQLAQPGVLGELTLTAK